MNREEAIKILKEHHDHWMRLLKEGICTEEEGENAIEALDVAIKALEQEPCDDEYIKVPKKALKYRTKGMVAYNAEWLKNHFDIERAVICGAQQPCDNAVSRQAGIDIIDRWLSCDDYNEAERHIMRAMQSVLYDLPPVTPQPKTGHWIEHPEIETSTPEYLMFYECSECGDRQCFCKSDIHKKRFCSNCGCRMIEPQEKQCADCNHYGKLSLDCSRCDDDCSMYEPQERSDKE